MNQSQKIDLSAIMKSHDSHLSNTQDNTKEEIKTDTAPTTETTHETHSNIHISPTGVKTISLHPDTPVTPQKEEEADITKIVEKVEATEEVKEERAVEEIEEINKVESKEITEEVNTPSIDSGEELFINYESDFKKKETRIIDKIKKLKEMPKTNFIFLSIIVMIFVFVISGLVYISPDTPRYQNIKANILSSFNMFIKTEPIAIIEVPLPPIEKIPEFTEVIPLPQTNSGTIIETIDNQEPRGEFDVGGYKIEVETLTGSGGIESYQFNEQVYTSKEELNNAIMIELPKLKKEKLINTLLNIFSK